MPVVCTALPPPLTQDGDDAGVINVPACSNTLSLLMRDAGLMRFVKYVSAAAPGSRCVGRGHHLWLCITRQHTEQVVPMQHPWHSLQRKLGQMLHLHLLKNRIAVRCIIKQHSVTLHVAAAMQVGRGHGVRSRRRWRGPAHARGT